MFDSKQEILVAKLKKVLRNWRTSMYSKGDAEMNDYLRTVLGGFERNMGNYTFTYGQREKLVNILEQLGVDVSDCF